MAGWRERLAALDERLIWSRARPGRPPVFARIACAAPVLAGLAASWSHYMGWPLAIVATAGLTLALAAIMRFWFGPSAR